MATDWGKPTVTSLYTTVLDEIKSRDESIAKQDFGSDTNIPDGFIRFNKTTKKPELKVAGLWVDLVDIFNINVDKVDGKDASAFEEVVKKGAANGYCGLGADSKVPAANLPSTAFKGGLVRKTTTQTITSDANVDTKVTFGTVVYETETLWNVANNRFIIPAGVTRAKLTANIGYEGGGNNWRRFSILKNQALANGCPVVQSDNQNGLDFIWMIGTPWLSVVAGDQFELNTRHNAGANRTIGVAIQQPWFSIELI